MSQQDYFSTQARNYARFRPVYPDEMYQFIFKHLREKQIAWDCGTGSGQVAGNLADHFKTVYASDISPGQLKHAVKKENIKYANMPAENTNYPSGIFDLITVAQAIHWFDFDSFFREVKRVAKNQALIAVIGYGKLKTDHEIDVVVENLYEEAFGKYFKNCRKYVYEGYKTIPFPFEEVPTPRFTIKNLWTLEELEGFFNSWSAIQQFKEKEGYNPVDHTIRLIKEKLSKTEPLSVSFPVFMRLGIIHKTE